MHDAHKIFHQLLVRWFAGVVEHDNVASVQGAEPLDKIESKPTEPIFMRDYNSLDFLPCDSQINAINFLRLKFKPDPMSLMHWQLGSVNTEIFNLHLEVLCLGLRGH